MNQAVQPASDAAVLIFVLIILAPVCILLLRWALGASYISKQLAQQIKLAEMQAKTLELTRQELVYCREALERLQVDDQA